MSYPPRPPMGMPPMGPGMMTQGYGFTPMGMMPNLMQMRMMPPSNMMQQPSTNNHTSGSTSKPSKKLVPQEIPKDTKTDKPPVTTVFVGNISDRAPDPMIRQMLQRCGNVLSWKRVQGASGKLQAFGFCEYEDPEATLRCIRLLNEWKIADKALVVKVDAKTKTLLDEHNKKKKAAAANAAAKDGGKEEGEMDDDDEKEGEKNGEKKGDLDEFTMREDRVAKAGLDAIMREYHRELTKQLPPEPSVEEKKEKMKAKREKEKLKEDKEGIDDMDLEEDAKKLINREINKFRDAHKEEDEVEIEKSRERERERRRRKKKKVPTATLR